jgi:hypothetical protein
MLTGCRIGELLALEPAAQRHRNGARQLVFPSPAGGYDDAKRLLEYEPRVEPRERTG